MTTTIDFEKLSKIDLSKHIEKKGRLSYMSWPVMVEQLRLHMPGSKVVVRLFDGKPYLTCDNGAMVNTYIVDAEGVELWDEWLPVMDYKNKSVDNPDVVLINKNIQRCKAKCISEYTGIALHIYKGEDLPEPPEKEKPKEDAKTEPEGYSDVHGLIDKADTTIKVDNIVDKYREQIKGWPIVWQKKLRSFVDQTKEIIKESALKAIS